jgi:histidine triad (HIT) family protein
MEKYFVEDCLFCKMVKGEIAVPKIWENEEFFCIADKFPSAPVHLLVIPKSHIDKTKDSLILGNSGFWGRYIKAVHAVILQEKLDKKGYDIRNLGGGYQAIDHEHIHIKCGHEV